MKIKLTQKIGRKICAGAIALLIATGIGTRPASAEVLPELSSWQPGIAAFNGQLYIAYSGANNSISIVSSPDGSTWSTQRVIYQSGASQVGVGLAAFGGRLYLAFDGIDRSHTINFISSADGLSWSGTTLFGTNTSTTTPALAASSNQLLIAWGGNNGGQNINVGCITCTSLPFGSKVVLTNPTCCGVGLTSLNGNFFLSANTGGTIKTLSSTAANPLTFTVQTSTSSSGAGPANTSSNGFVYVGWPGPVGSQALNLATYQVVSGTGLSLVSSSQTPAGQVSGDNPGLAFFNGHLYYAWRGTDSHINVDLIF
jgi:hypothetical protein